MSEEPSEVSPPTQPGELPPPLPGNDTPREQPPWHQRRLVILLLLLSVGPLALPLVWMHRKWSWYTKLYITVSVIVLTWACWVLTKASLAHLRELLQVIDELES